MPEKLVLPLHIPYEKEGTYFTLPFTMPAHTGELTLTYRYDRHLESELPVENGTFISRREANIIDLGLIAPDGVQVGASGSDKTSIKISETDATPGYHPCRLTPGEWQIIVGAYKVAPEGVNVTYELSFNLKARRLYKGDLHTHTLASDGVFTVEELGRRAERNGLDFLAITDHNQPVSREALPRVPGVTLIPGVEWTHFRGHANFLGVDKPYDVPYFANTPEEVRVRFESARNRGALIMINHPLDEDYGFRFDLESLPYDCFNVWNGPMRVQNIQAIDYWHDQLKAGKKIPVCGGSDYHRDMPFLFPGAPTTCVYAMSSSPDDILAALKAGHSYIIYAPDGPSLELTAGEAILGDTVPWPEVSELQITAGGLWPGDAIRVITASSNTTILEAPAAGRFKTTYTMEAPGFARIEILRFFLPGLPVLPALISNPVYFDGNRGEQKTR